MKFLLPVVLAAIFICSCSAKKMNTENYNSNALDSLIAGTLKTGKTNGENPSFKRRAPEEPKPLVIGDVEYSAPVSQMGFIVAIDKGTKKELWKKQIYTVDYKKDLEKDVQDVFIDSITGTDNIITIHNEKGETYELNIAAQTVIKK